MPPPPAPPDKSLENIGSAVVAGCVAPFVVAFVVVAGLPVTLYAAFVAQFFWTWFAAPFTSQPPPSLFVLAGALTFVRLATIKIDRRDYTADEAKVKHGVPHMLTQNVAAISLYWLIGYALHLLAGQFA